MLFRFLLYVNPVWYFNLKSSKSPGYFIDYEKITEAKKALVAWDTNFSDPAASKRDAAYQMWHKGFMKRPGLALMPEADTGPIHLKDNYRFIRRHFHPIWSWYILVLRLLGLKHPWKEIQAFWSQASVKRTPVYDSVYNHEPAYLSFQSLPVQTAPKVSVILPTLNRYPALTDALQDLAQQDYPNFEVIIIDQSTPFQKDFYQAFDLNLSVHEQSEKALWLARNTAIKHSKAPLLLLFDDDSRVDKDWISQHLKCLDFFQADISAGVSISKIGDKVPENYRFFRWADQLDTGNVMIKRAVFEQIGLFDRQFEGQRMGDGEFGLRAHLAGFRSVSNPYAQRLHLKTSLGGLREMGSWDGFRPKSWWAPRPVPSVLYLFRSYFGLKPALFGALLGVLPSMVPYRFKKNRYLLLVGSFATLLLLPLVLFQFISAWSLSSKKLAEGALIEPLPALDEDQPSTASLKSHLIQGS